MSAQIRERPRGDAEIELRARVGRWSGEGGERRFLLVAVHADGSALVGIGIHPEGEVTFGVALSDPEAILASDADLFALLPLAPATHADLEGAGLLDGHAMPLLLSLLALPLQDPAARDGAGLGIPPLVELPAVELARLGLMPESRVGDVIRPRRRARIGAPPPSLFVTDPVRVRYSRSQASLAVFDVGSSPSGDRDLLRRFLGIDPLVEAITTWAGAVADALAPGGIRLGGPGWTPRAHRHFAPASPFAMRRAQAARLHPAFAPIQAHDPALVAAIDAGIPHEAILDAALRRMLPQGIEPRFGPARMRRMRAIPAGLWPETLRAVVALAHGLRPENLPTTPAGWTVFAALAPRIAGVAQVLGLDLDPLLATPHAPWREPLARDEAARAARLLDKARSDPWDTTPPMSLSEAIDVADRLAHTLVRAVTPPSPGLSTEQARLREVRLAGRLLYGGRPLDRVVGISDAWHAGLDAFERRMPRPGDDMTWPALFADFRAASDIVLTCLTLPSALLAEGMSGSDDFGPGLAHCVGGYVPDCLSGRAHIVSVRRELPEGGAVRLSTAEIAIHPDGGLAVVQHKGPRNAPPPYEAETAVRHLLDAVRTGRLAVSPEAVALSRDGRDGEGDGIDWSSPAAIEASFSAWAPYLPRRVARAGPAGLRRTLDAMEAAGSGGPP